MTLVIRLWRATIARPRLPGGPIDHRNVAVRIDTAEDYRAALEKLHQLGDAAPGSPDDRLRREIEAAVEAYSQAHNNAQARRAKPDTDHQPRAHSHTRR